MGFHPAYQLATVRPKPSRDDQIREARANVRHWERMVEMNSCNAEILATARQTLANLEAEAT